MSMSTYFGLVMEFGSSEIQLHQVSKKFWGLSPEEAARRAAMNQLPIPVYRTGSQKSGWLVSAHDLAKHIDLARERAAHAWEKCQTAPSADETADPDPFLVLQQPRRHRRR